ncbi:MAG: polysaccharide deacetylase family protein [Chloroflexales bacterium]|nr:polysaccharide deacetylase family protein [Chloroflexales bacterium]
MNPFLKKLGFSAGDRVAIVHADDIGAYQASLPAIEELFAAGLVSSCAAMVPCPWFPAVAAWARRTPEADIGVHATLTAEYPVYRWGPISTRDPTSGLLDEEGYLHRTTRAVWAVANPQAATVELRAQLDRALAAGIDVTHIDSHMGASFSLAFLPGYVASGAAGRVPNFVLRLGADATRGLAVFEEPTEQRIRFQEELEEQGLPLVDFSNFMPLNRHGGRVAEAKALFDSLPAGLSYVILHPAIDTPELRAVTPEDWRARVADYEAFTSAELRAHVRDTGVQVIGWRAVRDAMRREGETWAAVALR